MYPDVHSCRRWHLAGKLFYLRSDLRSKAQTCFRLSLSLVENINVFSDLLKLDPEASLEDIKKNPPSLIEMSQPTVRDSVSILISVGNLLQSDRLLFALFRLLPLFEEVFRIPFSTFTGSRLKEDVQLSSNKKVVLISECAGTSLISTDPYEHLGITLTPVFERCVAKARDLFQSKGSNLRAFVEHGYFPKLDPQEVLEIAMLCHTCLSASMSLHMRGLGFDCFYDNLLENQPVMIDDAVIALSYLSRTVGLDIPIDELVNLHRTVETAASTQVNNFLARLRTELPKSALGTNCQQDFVNAIAAAVRSKRNWSCLESIASDNTLMPRLLGKNAPKAKAAMAIAMTKLKEISADKS